MNHLTLSDGTMIDAELTPEGELGLTVYVSDTASFSDVDVRVFD